MNLSAEPERPRRWWLRRASAAATLAILAAIGVVFATGGGDDDAASVPDVNHPQKLAQPGTGKHRALAGPAYGGSGGAGTFRDGFSQGPAPAGREGQSGNRGREGSSTDGGAPLPPGGRPGGKAPGSGGHAPSATSPSGGGQGGGGAASGGGDFPGTYEPFPGPYEPLGTGNNPDPASRYLDCVRNAKDLSEISRCVNLVETGR